MYLAFRGADYESETVMFLRWVVLSAIVATCTSKALKTANFPSFLHIFIAKWSKNQTKPNDKREFTQNQYWYLVLFFFNFISHMIIPNVYKIYKI